MRRTLISTAIAGIALLGASTLHAQWVVFDPSNYAEAVTEFEQLVKQYQLLVAQAQQLPINLGARYAGYSTDWTRHDAAGLLFAAPLLAALNTGDEPGAGYTAVVDALDVPGDLAARMSPDLWRRLTDSYATLELADSTNRLVIDQTGIGRTQGPLMFQTIQHVADDVANPGDAYQSEAALLQKLDASAALQLRQSQQTNQFLLGALEQQLVESKRKRDAEVRLMNATIYQWRFGQAYGADLFRNTAAALDAWQPF